MSSPHTEPSYIGVFDSIVGFGARPAFLVVDFVRAYTTPGAALFAPDVVTAVDATVALLEAARRGCVPVIFTRVEYTHTAIEGGLFVKKVPVLRQLVAGAPLAQIVPQLEPLATETVLVKQYPSAFFGTPLAPALTSLGIDTVVLVGCSTSGCIRATAIDGLQHGYRVIVPRECVGDRARAPHEANLFDIHAKYGDVVSRDEALAYFATLRSSASGES